MHDACWANHDASDVQKCSAGVHLKVEVSELHEGGKVGEALGCDLPALLQVEGLQSCEASHSQICIRHAVHASQIQMLQLGEGAQLVQLSPCTNTRVTMRQGEGAAQSIMQGLGGGGQLV